MDSRLLKERVLRFKPYYKWNTFNTNAGILHWIINLCFKPYYKWNTFNTKVHANNGDPSPIKF